MLWTQPRSWKLWIDCLLLASHTGLTSMPVAKLLDDGCVKKSPQLATLDRALVCAAKLRLWLAADGLGIVTAVDADHTAVLATIEPRR